MEEREKSITLEVADDDIAENEETFILYTNFMEALNDRCAIAVRLQDNDSVFIEFIILLAPIKYIIMHILQWCSLTSVELIYPSKRAKICQVKYPLSKQAKTNLLSVSKCLCTQLKGVQMSLVSFS